MKEKSIKTSCCILDLIWYASKNEYRQTYSSHALYKDGPTVAATTSAFDTYADEDSKY